LSGMGGLVKNLKKLNEMEREDIDVSSLCQEWADTRRCFKKGRS
jgi:hypothetical protein